MQFFTNLLLRKASENFACSIPSVLCLSSSSPAYCNIMIASSWFWSFLKEYLIIFSLLTFCQTWNWITTWKSASVFPSEDSLRSNQVKLFSKSSHFVALARTCFEAPSLRNQQTPCPKKKGFTLKRVTYKRYECKPLVLNQVRNYRQLLCHVMWPNVLHLCSCLFVHFLVLGLWAWRFSRGRVSGFILFATYVKHWETVVLWWGDVVFINVSSLWDRDLCWGRTLFLFVRFIHYLT